MGKAIARHEMIADYLDEMQTDIQALRALAVHGALPRGDVAEDRRSSSASRRSATPRRRSELERDAARSTARRRAGVTPLLKYLAAEKAVEMARRSMQIHGGVGYTKEYGAEKLLRDALVMPIYEGTSQIQSLMAMKDTLVRHHQEAAGVRDARRRRRGGGPCRRAIRSSGAWRSMQALSLSAQQHLAHAHGGRQAARARRTCPSASGATRSPRSWDPKRDFALAMLHAERLTRILADEAIAEMLLEQAKAHPERRERARALPRPRGAARSRRSTKRSRPPASASSRRSGLRQRGRRAPRAAE